MAQFVGFFPRQSIEVLSGLPTHNLDAIVEDQTQGRARLLTQDVRAPVYTAHQPTLTAHNGRQGMIVEFLAAFIYNRIHVNPRACTG